MRYSRVILQCKVCGKDFDVINARKDKAKYCSPECSVQGSKGRKAWNSGLTYDELYGDRAEKIKKKLSLSRSGEKNGMFNKTHSEETRLKISSTKIGRQGITYKEYLDLISEKERYFLEVTRITRLQPIHTLAHYEERGKFKYHLDHIYPISKGFENNIPAKEIGDISNLRFIPWLDNLKKGNRLDYENSVFE